nr:immunoglobulin light chain junction region [Macaca mulatta]MOX69185.1 immunoglobulin light chain junction region [Macaca mulatta]MOX69202.1 immunoglobulin light chain junction region [Macaca mulatta]MOX69318.1 immunoglobulin light chain junction region [Macaca mulatta]MOX69823.1 immunoglobulin light chain junction region [Macaca mulatta]
DYYCQSYDVSLSVLLF